MKYTESVLSPVIRESTTWAEVCRKLGLRPMSGSQVYIKSVAVKLGIDYSHFVGKLFNKGRKFGPKRPIEDYLDKGHFITSDNLKKRLFKEGIKKRCCERCGNAWWLKRPIPLELHHKNGDHWDNHLKNLEILCSNCHSLE